jgi:hypothetical protein
LACAGRGFNVTGQIRASGLWRFVEIAEEAAGERGAKCSVR